MDKRGGQLKRGVLCSLALLLLAGVCCFTVGFMTGRVHGSGCLPATLRMDARGEPRMHGCGQPAVAQHMPPRTVAPSVPPHVAAPCTPPHAATPYPFRKLVLPGDE